MNERTKRSAEQKQQIPLTKLPRRLPPRRKKNWRVYQASDFPYYGNLKKRGL